MTTEVKGCDYSLGRPDPKALYTNGYRFAYRYLGAGSPSKHLTDQERQALHAAGIAVGVLVEGNADDVTTGGARLGAEQALQAGIVAGTLGFPQDTVIVFSADQNITPANLPAAVDYFRGVGQLFKPSHTGAYCDTDLARELSRLNLASLFIKPAATSWSSGPFPYDVIQHPGFASVGGGSIDVCTAPTMPRGLWSPNTITKGDESMYILHASPSTSCYALRGNVLTPINLVDDLHTLSVAYSITTLIEVTDGDVAKGLHGRLDSFATPTGLTAAQVADELARRLTS